MRRIECNCSSIKGKKNQFAHFCVGAGRAGEILRGNAQEQLKMVQEDMPFRYMRFHGIFHEDMAVYKEKADGTPVYNWQYVDDVYDKMLELGIKPFVELGFMPDALASGDATVFWWKSNKTLPKDYDKWHDLIKAFVEHLTVRYGEEEVLTWFFEVWNEPNHPGFFVGTMEDYFKLYEYSAKAIKAVNPRYKVGGPATAGSVWVGEFIQYCHENHLPLDFITSHEYGVRNYEGDLKAEGLDEFGISLQILQKDPDFLVNRVKAVHEEVKTSSMPELPIYYTEWSTSYSSRDNIHDSYIQAPYILYNMKRLEGFVDAMSYWTFTDVFEEAGPAPTPFHGGFGLVNQQGIKKPAYFAYEYLGRLGDTELENGDSDSYACKTGDNVQVLAWNYTNPNQEKPDQAYYIQDLPAKEAESICISVHGMTPGYYEYKLHRVGYRCNDVYADYYDMGRPASLSRETVQALKEKNAGTPVETRIVQIEEGFEEVLKCRENEICFVELNRLQ